MGFRVIGRILLAQGLSSLGSSMSTVALAFMVYDLTGSVLHMGGIMAASTLPLVVTAWIGGAFLDRYSARNVMVLADIARALLIFSLPFLAGETVGLVYVIAALMGIFSALFNPGQVKLIGELVPREHLVKTNSYMGVSRDGAELVGFLLGGVIASLAGINMFGVVVAGYTVAFIVDALSYVASAGLLVGLPKGVTHEGTAPPISTMVNESPAVLGRLWRHPALRTNLLLAVFAVGALMMYMPNSYGLALDVFDRGSIGLAALEVFVAVGLIVGGLLFSRRRLGGDKNLYVFGAVVAAALCQVAVSFSGLFWLSVVLLGIGGVATVGMVVPSITMFQEIPPRPDKGRLIALRTGFGQLGVTVGFIVGGLLGAEIGIKQAFFFTGVGTIAIALLIYVPYRLGASRRARVAWTVAMDSGAKRSAARQIANDAAYTGTPAMTTGLDSQGAGVPAWVAATEIAAVDSTGG